MIFLGEEKTETIHFFYLYSATPRRTAKIPGRPASSLTLGLPLSTPFRRERRAAQGDTKTRPPCQQSESRRPSHKHPRPQRVSNVVFMGMGEPLLNLPSVLRAHEVLNKDVGIGGS